MSKFRSLVGDAERLGLSTTDALRAVVKKMTSDDWSPEAREAAAETRKNASKGAHAATQTALKEKTPESHMMASRMHGQAEKLHESAYKKAILTDRDMASTHYTAASNHAGAARLHKNAALTSPAGGKAKVDSNGEGYKQNAYEAHAASKNALKFAK